MSSEPTLVTGEQRVPGDSSLPGPGAVVGRYEIIRRLGEGGMGVVFEAKDPHLERVVAIKVLRPELGGGGAQHRLLREAQAMAQLSHPNVVPVYDSGPFGDGIYVAMELIDGETLELWMRQLHSWKEVLRMVIGAGRGLEAAHRKGLIHRDFKPANVLVGADGRPRVTDFGLARATKEQPGVDDEVTVPHATPESLERPLTQAGTMMGSPGYMAPEQYRGAQTSEATDQFSFCVTLYEALYGARPFKGESIAELAAAAIGGQVPPPPKDSPVPRWIFRVVARGLAPQPGARHASLGALLDALEADPGRLVRRIALGAAAVAALVGAPLAVWLSTGRTQACVGSEVLTHSVWNDDVKRHAESAFLGTGEPWARSSWQLTRDALDAWARTWAEARTEACRASRVRGEQTERQLTLRFECLDRRLGEFSGLVDSLAHADAEVALRATGAVPLLTPISTCANVKHLEDRRAPPPHLEAAAGELTRSLARAHGVVMVRAGEAKLELGQLASRAGELELFGLEADARETLGELFSLDRQFAAARVEFEKAARSALLAGDDVMAARVLARMVSLAGWRLNRPDEGRTWAALADGFVTRIGGEPKTEARLAEGRGDTEWAAGNRVVSLEAYRRALTLYIEAGGDGTLDVARMHSSIGWVLVEQGELEQARAAINQSRMLREKLLGVDHPALTDTWNELAMLAVEARDYEEAVQNERASLRVARQLSTRQFAARVALATTLAQAGYVGEASELAAGLQSDMATLDPDNAHGFLVEYHRLRVLLLLHAGKVTEALTVGRATLEMQERARHQRHPEVVDTANVVAVAAEAAGLWAESLALSLRYIELRADFGGLDSPRTGETLLRAARALLMLRRPAEALPLAERALVALEKGVLERSLRGEARRVLGEALKGTGGDAARAAALLQQAKEDAAAAKDEGPRRRFGVRF